MSGATDPRYEPRRLDPLDVGVPLSAPLRELPEAEREALLARRRATVVGWRRLGPRVRRRMAERAVAFAVLFPVLTWLATPLGGRALLLQMLLGATYGAAIALLRPSGWIAGGGLALTGLLLLLLLGLAPGGFYLVVILPLHALIGVAVGVGERLDRTM